MPNNTPITDAELAEVKRLIAVAKLGPMVSVHITTPRYEHCANLCTRLEGHKLDYPVAMMQAEWADVIAATFNAFGPILARLEAAERERDDLEAEVEELRDNSIEYEKDCTKALCGLAREFNYEWDGDGATADDLREFISEIVVDAKQRLEAAEREQQRVHELANRLLDANNGLIDTIRKLDPEALCDWHDSIGGDEYLQRWLAARDAQQRREGAIEALEGIAKDHGIDGGKAYIAKVVYREFPDLLHMSVGVVDAADLMQAAKRLREGGE